MNHYIVSYDIADDRRREKVADVVLGWGVRIQWSVYSCVLSATGLERLRAAVDPLLNHNADQVLIIDLGPLDGRGASCILALGRPYCGPKWEPVIV